jgi:hypothetical protein
VAFGEPLDGSQSDEDSVLLHEVALNYQFNLSKKALLKFIELQAVTL